MYELLYVFIGGGAGSLCRYALGLWLPRTPGDTLPWATLLANWAGCLVIGLLLGCLERRPAGWMQLLLVTGFCGGFTTFSTFSNETLAMLRQGLYGMASAYLFLSLAGGLACTACGFAFVRLITHTHI